MIPYLSSLVVLIALFSQGIKELALNFPHFQGILDHLLRMFLLSMENSSIESNSFHGNYSNAQLEKAKPCPHLGTPKTCKIHFYH